jgi:hypothetical protein
VAITLVGSHQNRHSSASPSTGAIPSWTPATDDVIVVFSHTTNTTSISAVPAGWVNILGGTTIIEPGDTTEYLAVLYHKVTSGEATAGTTTYTITNLYAASETCMVMSAVFRGVDPTTVVDNFGTDSNAGNSTTHRLAAITGTGGALSSNSMVVSSVSADGAANYTDPGGWTMRQEQTALDPGAWLGTRDALTTANTDVTVTNITSSLSGEMVSCSVALLEATGGVTDLVVADLAIVCAMDAVVLTQVHTLVVADAAVVCAMDNVVLVQAFTLVVADATVVCAMDAVVLTQVHTLAVADAAVVCAMDNVVLTQVHELVVADAAVVCAMDNVVLTQVHELVVADLAVACVMDNVELESGASTLDVADMTVVCAMDAVVLTQDHALVVADMAVVCAMDNVELEQIGFEIVVPRSYHAELTGTAAHDVTMLRSFDKVQIVNLDDTEPLHVYYTTTGATPPTAAAGIDDSYIIPALGVLSARCSGMGFVASIVGDGNEYSIVGHDNLQDGL